MRLIKLFFCFLFVGLSNFVSSSTPDASYLIVDQIILHGNERTKRNIVLREVDFKSGDTLQLTDTVTIISQIEKKLFNTKLFNEIDIEFVKKIDDEFIVIIHLVERWYIFPIPAVALADRNFSEFLQRRGGDRTRLVFGIDYQDINFRGRREKLDLLVQTGFYNKYELFL